MHNNSTKQNETKDVTKLSKRKRRKKTQSLYEKYFEDSKVDCSSISCAESDGKNCEMDSDFTVGMDVDILLQQTIQNTIQSVCLEDCDGSSSFGDYELNRFAAAVKNNTSIVSLQIRYLNVGDSSLVPLCNALLKHPSLRALDLSGTRGGVLTGAALCNLVCSNCSIIFVRVDDAIVNSKHDEIIQMATRYNAMICVDPNSNPFQLGLLHKIGFIEEREQEYNQQLNAKPWLLPEDDIKKNIDEKTNSTTKKKAKSTIRTGMHFGTEVCAQFINGRCAYGSRCKYFHPDKTIPPKNTSIANDNKRAVTNVYSLTSSTTNTTDSGHQRLKSRLKPPHFTLKHQSVSSRLHESEIFSDNSIRQENSSPRRRRPFLLCASCVAITVCSMSFFYFRSKNYRK